MKRLIQKKWFRISVRVAVGGTSLLVLAWLWLNWWGASRKNLATASARAAGLPLTLEDFTANMPPADQNFARNGIFKQWDEAYEKGDRDAPASPSSPRGTYESMCDEVFDKAFRRDLKTGTKAIDFSLLPPDGPYGQTAESFLAEYDRRHAKALENLQAGFALPEVRRPLVPSNFSNAAQLPALSEAFGLRSRKLYEGLQLRSEAAMVTGDSVKAAESVETGFRFAHAIGSRGTVVSTLIEAVGIRAMFRPLKKGIDEHRWTPADLDRFESALGRFAIRKEVRRAIESEVLMIHAWQGLKDERERSPARGMIGNMGDVGVINGMVAKGSGWVPAALFDLNATELINHCVKGVSVAGSPGSLKVWWDEGERMLSDYRGKKDRKSMIVSYPVAAVGLKSGARIATELRLAMAACALERHHVEHGTYPDTLEALPPEVSIDPLYDIPFKYRVKDGTFVLYSMGPDGIDNGGVTRARRAEGDPPDWIW